MISYNLFSEVSNGRGITKAGEVLEKVMVKQHTVPVVYSTADEIRTFHEKAESARRPGQSSRAGSLPTPILVAKPCSPNQTLCNSTTKAMRERVSLGSGDCM